MGGSIVAGYFGNPKIDTVFDSAQSPSPIFNSHLLNIFNHEENSFLNESFISLEFPGIQTFYNFDDKEIPLEYEVTPVELRAQIYTEFSEDTYKLYIEEAVSIFNKFRDECFSENQNLIKFRNECDLNFTNNYTHGGFFCVNNNFWSN